MILMTLALKTLTQMTAMKTLRALIFMTQESIYHLHLPHLLLHLLPHSVPHLLLTCYILNTPPSPITTSLFALQSHLQPLPLTLWTFKALTSTESRASAKPKGEKQNSIGRCVSALALLDAGTGIMGSMVPVYPSNQMGKVGGDRQAAKRAG
jgi:hypothetical protein